MIESKPWQSARWTAVELEQIVRAEHDADGAPDEVLVRAMLDGDEHAVTRLVRRYLRKAMAAALEHVATREDAEDVVQETFRRVVDSIARFDAARGFAPWFFTILRNTARNVAKRQHLRAHVALVDEMPSSEPGPYETTRRHEIRHRIGLAVDRLPAMQQTCFRLCMVEGLTSVEAANALGLAESTVRVHLFHARRSLQVLLGDWREEAEDA